MTYKYRKLINYFAVTMITSESIMLCPRASFSALKKDLYENSNQRALIFDLKIFPFHIVGAQESYSMVF